MERDGQFSYLESDGQGVRVVEKPNRARVMNVFEATVNRFSRQNSPLEHILRLF